MRFLSLLGAATVAATLAAPAYAADPESGAINDETHSTSWSGFLLTPNPGGSDVPLICEEGTPTCDVYRFEVNITNIDPDADDIVIELQWDPPDVDVDVYVFDENTGQQVGSGTSGLGTFETVFIPAVNGRYRVDIIPWAAVATSYTGAVKYLPFDENKSRFGFIGAFGPGTLGVLLLAGLFATRRGSRQA